MVWQKAVTVLVLIGSVGLAGRAIPQSLLHTDSSTQLSAATDPKAVQQASDLVPVLLDNDVNIREQAFQKLNALDISVSLSALVQALKDKDWQIQVVSAYTLGRFGAKAKPAISELNSTIKDKNADVRFVVAQALGNIGAEDVVPALTEALQDQDENVRFAAAEALVKLGSDAKAAIPVLMKTLRDGNWFVRTRAANAFVHLAPQSSSLTPALIEAALNNPLEESPWFGGDIESKLQRQQRIPTVLAFDALAEIGAEAAPPLIESLKSDGILARSRNPTLALVEMGSKASSDEVVTLLIQALQHPDWTIRKKAALALGSIGSKAAIPALVNAAPSRWVGHPGDALGQIGFKVILNKKRIPSKEEGVVSVIPTLAAALQDEDWQIRTIATAALGLTSSEAAIPFLDSSLRDQDWRVRSTAATALGKINSDKTVNSLAIALQDQDWRVRRNAVYAAVYAIEQSDQTTPILLRLLNDDNENVRLGAAITLGGESDLAVPILINALQHNKDAVARLDALSLLSNSKLETAALAMIQALKDENVIIRAQAVFNLSVSIRLGQIGASEKISGVGIRLSLGEQTRELVVSPIDGSPALRAGVQPNDVIVAIDGRSTEGISIEEAAKLIRGIAGTTVNLTLRRQGSLIDVSLMREVIELHAKYFELLKTAAIPALINSLKDESAEVRRGAASALGEAGETAVPALIEASQDKNERVRIFAIESLGKIGSQSAISAIRAALQDESEDVRTSAAAALGDSGIQSATNNLQNDDWQIRRSAAEEIGLIGVGLTNLSSPTVQALIRALQDPNPNVRTSAAATLVKFSSPRGGNLIPAIANVIQKAAPSLIDSLESGDSLARLDAIFVLGAIGFGAQVAVPHIQNKLKDENWLVRYGAAVTLLKINPKDESAVPVLAEIFSNPNYAQMIAIDDCCTDHPELETLANIGSDQAIAALINSLQISDEKLRYTYYLGPDSGDLPPTATALIKVGSKAIPALIVALGNENVRFIAAEILGQIGAKSIPSLLEVLKRKLDVKSALSEILKDKDIDIRRSAVYALGQIGKKDLASKATVIEILTKVMNDESEHLDVRWMAAASMAKMGKPVEQFFVDHNLPKPVNDVCIESRFIDRFLGNDFDLYAGRCLYSAGGRGAGLAQIYQQIRVLLSGNLSSSSTTPKPAPSPTR